MSLTKEEVVRPILCIIQSWKLKMKMNTMRVVKDALTFLHRHKG